MINFKQYESSSFYEGGGGLLTQSKFAKSVLYIQSDEC